MQLDVMTHRSPVWAPTRQAWKSAKEFFSLPWVVAEGSSVTVQVSPRLSQPKVPTESGFVVLKQDQGLSRPPTSDRRSWALERLVATLWSWMLLAPVRPQAASSVALSQMPQKLLVLLQLGASLVE